jgi:hypothetical protein
VGRGRGRGALPGTAGGGTASSRSPWRGGRSFACAAAWTHPPAPCLPAPPRQAAAAAAAAEEGEAPEEEAGASDAESEAEEPRKDPVAKSEAKAGPLFDAEADPALGGAPAPAAAVQGVWGARAAGGAIAAC